MATSAELPPSFHVTSKIDFSKPIDKSSFKGQSVLVTGGASGIGLGCVTAFAEAGAHVTILDLNATTGTAAAANLTALGHNVTFHATDVTSWSSQVAGFKAALAHSPSNTLDIVVASAGLPNTRMSTYLAAQPTSLDKDPEPPSSSVYDVNFTGAMYTAHLAMHYFRVTLPNTTATTTTTTTQAVTVDPQTHTQTQSQSKQLIFLGSTLGYTSTTDCADYTAAKHAVRGLWKALRYMPHALSQNPDPSAPSPSPTTPRFRTNLVAPTFIDTPMTAHALPFVSRVMRPGSVADVVEAVLRVAGDETVEGRAVCVPAGTSSPGDENFDLEDDWRVLEGGALVDSVAGGSLRGLELFCGRV